MVEHTQLLEEMKHEFLDKYSSFVSTLNDQVNDTLHDLGLEDHVELLQVKLVSDVLVSMILSDFA